MNWEMLEAVIDNCGAWLLFTAALLGIEIIALTALLFAGQIIRWSFSSVVTCLERKAFRGGKIKEADFPYYLD